MAGEDLVERTIFSLRKNNFRAWFAPDPEGAERLFWSEIWEERRFKTVSWGDSLTLRSLDILPQIRSNPDVRLIETFDERMSREERNEKRREALSCDLFLTGTNAVTVSGKLVNLDMVGNRTGGILFGPGNVVVFAGINKVVETVEEAFKRIRTVAAPLNAKRHVDLKVPCQMTGRCMDCDSPQRICNAWTIMEKSFPRERIGVVLIGKEMGF